MPKITFKKPQIRSIVTTVGDKVVSIESESEMMGLDEFTVNRLKKTIGLGTRRVVSNGVCTSDLCVQSAEKIFEQGIINKQEIESVLLVTQTGDYKAPSTAIIIQDRLGLPVTTLAFDINLGCSGYIYLLSLAKGLISTKISKNVLLLTSDTYSKVIKDLDEFKKLCAPVFKQYGLTCTFLVTPSSTDERIREIDAASSGFLYAVSSHSITGGDSANNLSEYGSRLAALSLKNPIQVGFGIHDAKSFQEATAIANGGIIGSAFIKAISKDEVLGSKICSFVEGIRV